MIQAAAFWPHQRSQCAAGIRLRGGVTHSSTVRAACSSLQAPILETMVSLTHGAGLEGTRLKLELPVAPRWNCWTPADGSGDWLRLRLAA